MADHLEILTSDHVEMTSFDWHNRYQQQARWTAQLRRYLYAKVHVTEANRVLEVGCGTGVILSDPELGKLNRFGLDLDEQSISKATQSAGNSLFCVGNGLSLPYPDSYFDLVFCHFYLLWVDDPGCALLEMKRVTLQGGYILALAEPDFGGRIDFPGNFHWIAQLQQQALEHRGANLEIGRQLSGLFARVGLKDIETGVLGGQWSGPEQTDFVKNEWTVLKQDLVGLLPDTILDQYELMDALAWKNRERAVFVPTFYAIGQV